MPPADPTALTKAGEFRRGWPVLVGSSFGAGVSLSCLLNYTTGLFARDLQAAIGLTRTQFGIACLLATIAVAVTLPVVGWLIDRFGVRGPAAFGAAGLALGYLALAILTTSVGSFFVLMVALGVLGACATTVSFTRAVASWFHRGRGLALGLTEAGIGVSGTILPVLVAAVMERHGWRAGYFTLAGVAALGIVSALALLRTRGERRRVIEDPHARADFRAALGGRLFWLLFAAFSGMALAFGGLLIHFVSILRDMGLGPIEAAGYAALIGMSVLGSRLVVGWLADSVHAPWLAAAACAFGMIGCVLLASGGGPWVPLAAVSIGCALGTELDLLGYMAAHYFGLHIYGRIYAWQYAGVILSAGVSPFWIGWLADRTGSYRAALFACGAIAFVVICLFLLFPRIPAHRRAIEPALDA